MLHSLKKETGHERPKDKSTNKKTTTTKKKNKLWDNTHPLSPHPHPDSNPIGRKSSIVERLGGTILGMKTSEARLHWFGIV